MRKAFFPLVVLLLLSSFFLWLGRGACVAHGVSVSLGLKSSGAIPFQVFWTETPKSPFSPENSRTIVVPPGGKDISMVLPVERVENLRMDFGCGPGTVRVSKVVLSGSETRVLDWHDFGKLHDISQFAIDAKGSVDVTVSGRDPYAVHLKPLGMAAKTRIAFFPALSLLFVAALIWIPLAGSRGIIWNASPRDGEPIVTPAFAMLVGLLILFRFALSARLPPAFLRSPWDDLWFLNVADSLLKGQWMGPYNENTLIKGCFGPMALAFSSFFGLPFLFTENVLYMLSCLFFVGVCARFSRNRLFLAASFALLLFNPLSFARGTFQLVHRNGMPLWQTPFIFGCMLLVFINARNSWRRLLAHALAAGATIWMFQNTREDGIWIWPFVLACLALSAVRAWQGASTRVSRIVRPLLCLVPLAVFLSGNAAVCLLNWKFYGLPLRNDRDAGNYAKTMQDLYVIKPDETDDARLSSPGHEGHYHSIYWSSICQAFDASPTLQKARGKIEFRFDRWADNDWSCGTENHGHDLFEDKPLFAMREGAAAAGFYSSLKESEAFWGAVHEELSAAFLDGRLQRRGFSATAMCAPFRAKDIPRILRAWVRAITHVATFKDTRAQPCYAEPWWQMAEWYERLNSVPGEPFFTKETVRREQPYIDRVNQLGRFYSLAMPWILVAAVVLFAVATARLLSKKKWGLEETTTAAWLFIAGILASFSLHTACIAYVSATTFYAFKGSYLTSSYQLSLMFVIATVALCLQMRNGAKEKTLVGSNGRHGKDGKDGI